MLLCGQLTACTHGQADFVTTFLGLPIGRESDEGSSRANWLSTLLYEMMSESRSDSQSPVEETSAGVASRPRVISRREPHQAVRTYILPVDLN